MKSIIDQPSNIHRKFGACIVCVAEGDEADKEIHGLGLCEKHYRADLRRRGRDEAEPVRSDRHAGRELKSHQFVAEVFQKFLHRLNDDKVTAILAAEQIQEIRLLLTPHMVRSQRIAVPRSLPREMLQTYEEEADPTPPTKPNVGDKGTLLFSLLSPVTEKAPRKRKSRNKEKQTFDDTQPQIDRAYPETDKP